MKIRPVGDEVFHADGRTDGGQTDMTKPTVVFRSFANGPKNNYSNIKVCMYYDHYIYSVIMISSKTNEPHFNTEHNTLTWYVTEKQHLPTGQYPYFFFFNL